MLKRAATKLYNWVAFMIILGALLGHFYPIVAVKMQPLADGFIVGSSLKVNGKLSNPIDAKRVAALARALRA